MIRVLVVEDSPTTRALLVRLLHGDPEIGVVGEAKDGLEAVSLARRLRPDVVVMDVVMPGIDGFEATKRIMFEAPTPVVIVSTSLATREVETSLEALRAGAVNVLPKPSGPGSPSFDDDSRRFVRAIKAMSQVKVVRRWPDARPSVEAEPLPVVVAPRGHQSARVIAIAASTGGPAALHRVLSELPSDFGAPILIVQHISPGFTEGLARWLDGLCRIDVKLAVEGEVLSPGIAYLAPEGAHLGVSSRNVALSNAPPINGFRPSATFLFDSSARAFGANCLAVVLTGMGHDGVDGLREVRRLGGRVAAQDETTSVIFGMPGAAVSAGLVDVVLPVDAVADHLVQSVVGAAGIV